jgi:phosphatidylserine/phosphatidylglycerophosphate/cardiolipin synthase-like enzyme
MAVDESQELLADADLQAEARLGALSFDPSRVPEIPVEPVVEPVEIVAAVSPDSSYRLVKSAIEAAADSVDLYIYNVSADYLVALLEGCLSRGVALRLMYDTHDTRGDEEEKIRSLVGAEIRTAPSSGRRRVFTVCHQKFAIIDGVTLLIGSANWATSSIPRVEASGGFKKGNREWLLLIRSPQLAERFGTLFQADWDIPELPAPDTLLQEDLVESAPVHIPALLANPPDEVFDLAAFESGPSVAITPIVSPQNYVDIVLGLIEQAQESIDIQQQYIVGGVGSTERLLQALAAKKADVAIRVIVSPAFRKVGAKDSWEKSFDTLDAYGLASTLRAMNLRFYTHCHNKGVIVDRRAVVVSSTNWSDNSIDRAREAGVVVDSPDVAGYFASVFDFDWSIAWDAADVPANLVAIFEEAMFRPAAFDEIHPADLA